ncbi:MAG: hypothetical protein JST87_06185 [Bacteroidetes bacterium]|nr:hypothetical protein [Bacteroidota bacterium]
MRSATVNELKNELENLPATELKELCLRLAKFKKENKELLTYLLFEANDEENYIKNVKSEMDEQFASMNKSNLYFSKKTIRKILRSVNKYIRYTGSKQLEIELLTHFCISINESGIAFQSSTALLNLYNTQVKKINAAILTLHEDLQYDYLQELKKSGVSVL